MEFCKIANETEEQMLWRLGQAKDNGLLDSSWDEIGELMNKTFRADESEYRTSSAYRKYYQYARNFFNAGIFKDKDDESCAEELRNAKEELRKEKQKLFDERVEWRRRLRDEARMENDLEYLGKLINENSTSKLIPEPCVHIKSDNDMIVCVSDLHLGATNANVFGEYDSDIAAKRLGAYLEHIQEIAQRHHCENAYCVFLGDLVSGEIHLTCHLENRETMTEQVQKVGELLSEFVFRLSQIFNMVYVNGVSGNHSRIGYKDEVLRNNRLDNLIPWYMKAALKHVENVAFIDGENYDATIGSITVRGNNYLLVHGDYDKFTESGVSKLVMMVGYKPCGILMGHMHHNSYDDIAGVKIIRSGSFAGTGDDYCITKRLFGKPSQMVVIANSSGVGCCYPIDL